MPHKTLFLIRNNKHIFQSVDFKSKQSEPFNPMTHSTPHYPTVLNEYNLFGRVHIKS